MAEHVPQPRRGCVCAPFITEPGGTQRTSYARCAAHRRLLEDNRVED